MTVQLSNERAKVEDILELFYFVSWFDNGNLLTILAFRDIDTCYNKCKDEQSYIRCLLGLSRVEYSSTSSSEGLSFIKSLTFFF